MMMRLISPRRTAPYQTLDSSSRITSPSTVAPGTTHALEWMVGPFCSRGTMPSCPVDSESGSICIRDEREHGTFSPSSQDYSRRCFTQSRCPVPRALQHCNKRLAPVRRIRSHRAHAFENYSHTGHGAGGDCAVLFCRIDLLSGCRRCYSLLDGERLPRCWRQGK